MVRPLIALLSVSLIAGSLLAFNAPESKPESAAGAAGAYSVDPVHSSVVFKIKHANLASFHGRFNDVSGTFTLGEGESAQPAFDITIKADSVDTNNAGRDKHLKTPDFFNAAEFPEITFKSTAVRPLKEKTYEVTGDLTLRGQTKPVTAVLELVGTGEQKGKKKAGFDGLFTINRHDFGVSYGKGALGDDVTVMFGLEGQMN